MPKSRESIKRERQFDVELSSGNVFKDIGFDDDEAASLMARAELISRLRDLIESSGLSQRQIARELGVGQPRIAEIMGMKIQCFSVDLLLKYLSKLGTKVSFCFEQAEVLEEPANPRTDWTVVRRYISDELLTMLLGDISEINIKRYSEGKLNTPRDVAARLHFLTLVIEDLRGSYDTLGVKQWFVRPRKRAFNGKTPLNLLKGKWHPEDTGPQKVREFTHSLNYRH